MVLDDKVCTTICHIPKGSPPLVALMNRMEGFIYIPMANIKRISKTKKIKRYILSTKIWKNILPFILLIKFNISGVLMNKYKICHCQNDYSLQVHSRFL